MADHRLKPDPTPVGYYVHHHGSGHMQRAKMVIRHISRPVVLFSSLPRPDTLSDNTTYIQLPDDAVANYLQPAGGVLHYTPYDDRIFRRNQVLIDSWRTYGICELYVDVSIEVAVLAKLYGLRVGHALMLGRRTDAAHSFGYQAVDYLLAHMAEQYDDPAARHTTTPISYSGGISRYPKQKAVMPASVRTAVVTMSPVSTENVAEAVMTAASQNPDIMWHIVGSNVVPGLPNLVSHGIVEDPYGIYQNSDVIIGSGGNNTIMEAASLGKPYVCMPEPRPYDEQVAAARALQRLHAAVYLEKWPEAGRWKDIFRAVLQVDPTAFQAIVSDDAAIKAAAIIESGGRSDKARPR